MKQIATASTPAAPSCASASRTSASSSGVRMRPSQSTRSVTGNLSQRGTSGSGAR